MPEGIEWLIGLCVGVGLAAGSGFRVFVPMLVANIAAMNDVVPPGMEGVMAESWIASPMATVVFGVAAAVEVGGYYIPWVDNLLDTIATPMALGMGTVAVGTMLGDMDPVFKWAIAAVTGGGAAGTVQLLTVGTRALSTVTTGGLGNPAVSTAEAGGSVVMAILAVVIPIIAAIVALVLIVFLWRLFFKRKKRAAEQAATPAT